MAPLVRFRFNYHIGSPLPLFRSAAFRSTDNGRRRRREIVMPMNYFKTAVLLAGLTAILLVLGGTVGGQTGLVMALVFSLVMNVVSLWGSDTIVLRMHGAQEVDAQSAPEYYALVEDLVRRADLPMPRVCIMNNPQPNAFATGRSPSRSAVCASTGLLEMLSREEVAGVIAHELAHIKS